MMHIATILPGPWTRHQNLPGPAAAPQTPAGESSPGGGENRRVVPAFSRAQFDRLFRTDGTLVAHFPKVFAPKMNRFNTNGVKKTKKGFPVPAGIEDQELLGLRRQNPAQLPVPGTRHLKSGSRLVAEYGATAPSDLPVEVP